MKHLGIEFEEMHVSLYSDTMLEEMSPYFSNNKVLLLIHNDHERWDSLAIIDYLSTLYPEKTDPEKLAVMYSICAEMHSSFIALRNELPMNCRRVPSKLALSDDCLADIKRIQLLWHYARDYSDGNSDWLLGSFSMADAMFAPVVLRFPWYQVSLQK